MPTRSIIITDLTRFKKDNPDVCIAGSDVNTGECIRPVPYLTEARCQELNILPGAILTGEFIRMPDVEGPHQEDHSCTNLQFDGTCTSDAFKTALQANLFDSVSNGFEVDLAPGQKSLPLNHVLDRSIITLQLEPADIVLVEDEYNPGRIKVHFTDGAGHSFRYLPITDLGFYRHAMAHHSDDDLDSLNDFIHAQEELYIRLGLTRYWVERSGYWMQVNGIYTFPNYHQEIRSYG
jgi:hypothetical protein